MIRAICLLLAGLLSLSPSALLYLLNPAAPRLLLCAPAWAVLLICAVAWHATWVAPLLRALRYTRPRKPPARGGLAPVA